MLSFFSHAGPAASVIPTASHIHQLPSGGLRPPPNSSEEALAKYYRTYNRDHRSPILRSPHGALSLLSFDWDLSDCNS